MTAARRMFIHPLADADPMPTWLTALLSAGGVSAFAGVTALISNWRNSKKEERVSQYGFQSKQAEVSAQVQKDRVHEEAVLEAARLTAQTAAEQRYFDALQQFNKDHKDEVDRLRVELNDVRKKSEDDKRTLGHQIRELQGQVTVSLNVYHELFNVTTLLAAQLKQNRARLKRLIESTPGGVFDEEEFMPIDITPFDPRKLFSQFGAPNQKSGAAFMPSKSTTARIEIIGEE